MTSLVEAAARNNARWCDAMCAAHGVSGEFTPGVWSASRRTPPFYPDAVTLRPGGAGADLVRRIDTSSPGASVKDSFADVDLAPHGFAVLFEAQWLRLDAGPAERAPEWHAVRDATALRAWGDAWGDADGLFIPALLADPHTTIVAARDWSAGAVLTVGDGVVGASNLFGPTGWPLVRNAAHALAPGTPIVGYEHGPDLIAALEHGAAPLGPLCVWVAH